MIIAPEILNSRGKNTSKLKLKITGMFHKWERFSQIIFKQLIHIYDKINAH